MSRTRRRSLRYHLLALTRYGLFLVGAFHYDAFAFLALVAGFVLVDWLSDDTLEEDAYRRGLDAGLGMAAAGRAGTRPTVVLGKGTDVGRDWPNR